MNKDRRNNKTIKPPDLGIGGITAYASEVSRFYNGLVIIDCNIVLQVGTFKHLENMYNCTLYSVQAIMSISIDQQVQHML